MSWNDDDDTEEVLSPDFHRRNSVDDGEEAQVPLAPEAEDVEEEQEPETEIQAGGVSDPITTYLREIGSVPLLSREREVALAMQIELGKNQIQQTIFSTPMALDYVVQLGVGIARGGFAQCSGHRDTLLPPYVKLKARRILFP